MTDDGIATRVAPRPGGARATARVLVVAACLLYIWLAPVPRQVFGRYVHGLRNWMMFSGVGLEVTEVRYWQVLPDGGERPLSRADLTAAGVKEPRAGRFSDEEDALATARRLCRELGAGADVRFRLRKATRKGWQAQPGADTNQCGATRGASKPAPRERAP